MRLPESPLYGPQTEAAIESFGAGGAPRDLVRAFAEVKKAAVLAQQETSALYPEAYFPLLLATLDGIIRGDLDDHFPIPLRQGGAGTSFHMNLNEVAANLANLRYEEARRTDPALPAWAADPLEHINRYQSTNDTFPTAVKIVVLKKIHILERRVTELQEALVRKELEYSSLLLTGRTELRDALPMTLGQVFGAWAAMFERDRWRLNKLMERVRLVALGGTAVGTCYFAPRNYIYAAERQLRAVTGLPLCRSQNLPDEVAHTDGISEAASGFRLCAGNLYKMSGDLLLYTSSLAGELVHPELQYGSTIMPLKTNPVLVEYIRGLSVAAKHEAEKVEEFSNLAQLQLNAFLPFLAEAFLSCAEALEKALETATVKLLPRLVPDADRMRRNLFSSPAILNSLRDRLDYRSLKELSRLLSEERPGDLASLKGFLLRHTRLPEEEIEMRLEPGNLTTNALGET
jgi:aspartate ammonia-lyase